MSKITGTAGRLPARPRKPMDFKSIAVYYSIPDLPGGENPHSADWVEIIKKEVDLSSKPVVLIGHSLGTRAVLLYLDKYQRKVDTVILIAPVGYSQCHCILAPSHS